MPVEDSWADVVISNGVINLCADKQRVFSRDRACSEIGRTSAVRRHRQWKPVPAAAVANIDLWTA